MRALLTSRGDSFRALAGNRIVDDDTRQQDEATASRGEKERGTSVFRIFRGFTRAPCDCLLADIFLFHRMSAIHRDAVQARDTLDACITSKARREDAT
jgi:hypothetical protein